ncbi:16S rRNA (guanine(966)-N(2))-methyltransferase RsmD [Okibacterium endophyticum]
MTRIVAGVAGSLTLTVPRQGTRPTSDRVREAVFSALDARDAVHGARVLDLYAGSGALGLEAASRGAASVDLVERHSQAAQVCRRNASTVLATFGSGLAPDIRVSAVAVQQFLDRADGEWDLVFFDPPYDLSEDELAQNLASLVPVLSEHALVLVERSSRTPEPVWPGELTAERSKSYGETVVWWAGPA